MYMYALIVYDCNCVTSSTILYLSYIKETHFSLSLSLSLSLSDSKKLEISSPTGFEHTVHVGFDPVSGEFTVSTVF